MRHSPLWLIAALAASLPAHAVDAYLGAGVTQAPAEDEFRVGPGASFEEDNDPFARFFGGVWINENFAVEAAYHDFGRSQLRGLADVGYDLEADGWSLGVVYEYGDAVWAPYTKIGYFSADIEGEITTIAGPQRINDSDDGLMLEGGVRWTPNDRFSLRGGYEWFDFNDGGDGGLTIAAQISF
ncbi:MAG TPA: outer membrane beta-barrel protein [Patescibacteria group bacterium]|nr:outer membrane beta-barrel protein [Patescibacteria group bacterium]